MEFQLFTDRANCICIVLHCTPLSVSAELQCPVVTNVNCGHVDMRHVGCHVWHSFRVETHMPQSESSMSNGDDGLYITDDHRPTLTYS
jgi:hypothetical protein